MDKMKRYFLAGYFLCSLSLLHAQNYNELVERAMEYTFKDSLKQAESLFQQALKLDPKNARNALLFSNLGTVQKRMGELDEAIKSYTMALNITPYSTAMLMNRASLYLDLEMEDKAYVDLCGVIDLLPEDIEARLYRAYIYMNRRQYNEARIDYNVILRQDFKHREARLGMALLDQKEGRHTAALDGLNALVEDEPKDKVLLMMRANMEVEQGQEDAALLDLDEVIRLNPKEVEAYLIKGDILLGKKKKAEARAAYEKAIELGVPRMQLSDKLKSCR